MESLEEKKKRAKKIFAALRKAYPDAKCALEHSNPLELLIATMLSAQCTDERVNSVTRQLFKKYKTAADWAKLSQKKLESEIRSLGFYRNKAKNIRAACKQLVEEYGGEVPDDMEKLLALPGVARKTANIVLGVAYGKATGIVVDTHVRRLAQRLGLSDKSDPNKIEQDLMEIFPKNQWIDISHMLIWHGRLVCTARNPQHEKCPLKKYCPTYAKED